MSTLIFVIISSRQFRNIQFFLIRHHILHRTNMPTQQQPAINKNNRSSSIKSWAAWGSAQPRIPVYAIQTQALLEECCGFFFQNAIFFLWTQEKWINSIDQRVVVMSAHTCAAACRPCPFQHGCRHSSAHIHLHSEITQSKVFPRMNQLLHSRDIHWNLCYP